MGHPPPPAGPRGASTSQGLQTLREATRARLTCYVGHTSRSGGPGTPGIAHTTCTAHSSPRAPVSPGGGAWTSVLVPRAPGAPVLGPSAWSPRGSPWSRPSQATQTCLSADSSGPGRWLCPPGSQPVPLALLRPDIPKGATGPSPQPGVSRPGRGQQRAPGRLGRSSEASTWPGGAGQARTRGLGPRTLPIQHSPSAWRHPSGVCPHGCPVGQGGGPAGW